MKLFEKKAPSNHIRIQVEAGSPALTYEKGDAVSFGALNGLWDYTTDPTNPNEDVYSINIGSPCAVFSCADADVAGNPCAVGDIVYMTSSGGITKTATGNSLFGTVVAKNGAAIDIAVNG